MFKKVGLQFKISLLILSIFFAMIIVSSLVNIILVNNANRKKSLDYLKKTVEAESYRGQNILKIEYNYLNEAASSIETLYNSGIRDRNVYLNIISDYLKREGGNTIGIGFLLNKNLLDSDASYVNNEFYDEIGGQFGAYIIKNNGTITHQGLFASDLNADYFIIPKNTLKPAITPIYSYDVGGSERDIYLVCTSF